MEVVLGVVTNLFTVLGDVIDAVLERPALCIGLASTVGGIGISWYKRLTNQRSGKRR